MQNPQYDKNRDNRSLYITLAKVGSTISVGDIDIKVRLDRMNKIELAILCDRSIKITKSNG